MKAKTTIRLHVQATEKDIEQLQTMKAKARTLWRREIIERMILLKKVSLARLQQKAQPLSLT